MMDLYIWLRRQLLVWIRKVERPLWSKHMYRLAYVLYLVRRFVFNYVLPIPDSYVNAMLAELADEGNDLAARILHAKEK